MGKNTKKSVTYKDAGVDIDAGNKVISMIQKVVASTHRPEVKTDLGGFGAMFHPNWNEYRNPVIVSATDGVGTKLKLAFETGKLDTVGIDLVAMSVNDLVVQGAEPLFFLDYFATGKLNPENAATVIGGIAEGCRQAGCALIGGETAEMPDFYQPGEFDLAGFAVGMVEKDEIVDGKTIKEGDVVLGLASSGPHSNGYSLIRHLFGDDTDNGLSFGALWGGIPMSEHFLEPTKIYVKSILTLSEYLKIKGLVHITGGGFYENIPRILPDDVCVELTRWDFPGIFTMIQHLGNVAEDEMLRTFNCGLGMLVIVAEQDAEGSLKILQNAGEEVYRVGKVVARVDGQVKIVG